MNTNYPTIALGTWSWGKGVAGGDQVFGNRTGERELRPVFDEAMKNGLNLWDSAVVYGMGPRRPFSRRLRGNVGATKC